MQTKQESNSHCAGYCLCSNRLSEKTWIITWLCSKTLVLLHFYVPNILLQRRREIIICVD
jgi:hypothetical protein